MSGCHNPNVNNAVINTYQCTNCHTAHFLEQIIRNDYKCTSCNTFFEVLYGKFKLCSNDNAAPICVTPFDTIKEMNHNPTYYCHTPQPKSEPVEFINWDELVQALKSIKELKGLVDTIAANFITENLLQINMELVQTRIDELEEKILKKIACLEKDVKYPRYENSNKPNKCPVCEGKGGFWGADMHNVLVGKKCHACEGKGIVWG